MKFKITRATILKRDSEEHFATDQSSELPDELKTKIAKGAELEVERYSLLEEKKHYKLELLEPIDGNKVWYVYATHCEPVAPEEKRAKSFLDKVVLYMEEKGYVVGKGAGELTLVGVEGVNLDGSPNLDEPNHFNDVMGVFEVLNGVPTWKGKWIATTEPGRHYTDYPLNSKGAARLAFGQYRAWQVGKHRNYEALVQTGGVVEVYRDANKDMARTNDAKDKGWFGINLHSGGDASTTNIGRYSAGCQVIRSTKDFAEFMSIVKKDVRYKENNKFVFSYALIPGDEL